jgi:heme/copper-type cytochrome/quinol oxidase subunit 3
MSAEVIIMKLILVAGSIIVPIIMVALQKKWLKLRTFFTIAAIITALIFGNIASIAIFNIIKDGTVFMTKIHGIFLNPYFLISGAYLGMYFLYSMLLRVLDDNKKNAGTH